MRRTMMMKMWWRHSWSIQNDTPVRMRYIGDLIRLSFPRGNVVENACFILNYFYTETHKNINCEPKRLHFITYYIQYVINTPTQLTTFL